LAQEKSFWCPLVKPGWQMAKTAVDILGSKLSKGIVVTKYEHSKGDLSGVEIWEAGHPVPDDNSFKATARAIELVKGPYRRRHSSFPN